MVAISVSAFRVRESLPVSCAIFARVRLVSLFSLEMPSNAQMLFSIAWLVLRFFSTSLDLRILES